MDLLWTPQSTVISSKFSTIRKDCSQRCTKGCSCVHVPHRKYGVPGSCVHMLHRKYGPAMGSNGEIPRSVSTMLELLMNFFSVLHSSRSLPTDSTKSCCCPHGCCDQPCPKSSRATLIAWNPLDSLWATGLVNYLVSGKIDVRN